MYDIELQADRYEQELAYRLECAEELAAQTLEQKARITAMSDAELDARIAALLA